MAEQNLIDMRVIFMGTPDFAVESLKQLIDRGINIVGVITSPDKPAGRGYKLQSSAVKLFAESRGLTILQPTNLKDAVFLDELKSLKADLQVVVAFRMLPEVVWAMPSMGTINLHGSLLPQYRGAAPINWAVINGEQESGVTTFFIRQAIDTGAVIAQRKVSIGPNDTAGDLHDSLMSIGAGLLVETVMAINTNDIVSIEQNEMPLEGERKSAPKLNRDNCGIDWSKSALEVHNFIRGLSPFPGAWSRIFWLDGKEKGVKIFETRVFLESKEKPGTVYFDEEGNLLVACGQGSVKVLKLQLEGKKRMLASDLLRGTSLNEAVFKTA